MPISDRLSSAKNRAWLIARADEFFAELEMPINDNDWWWWKCYEFAKRELEAKITEVHGGT